VVAHRPPSRFETFLALHHRDHPLLLANAFDRGSARLLASLGLEALATTSSGAAATFGRLDGGLDRDETLDNAAAIVSATGIPVSADLGNGFGAGSEDVARTVSMGGSIGLAGVSIEDYTGDRSAPMFPLPTAVERVEAAVDAAHNGAHQLVLTARADNYIHGRPDLGDTIGRLQAFQAAGADVLYAPGLVAVSDIRDVVSAVDRPVNVLIRPGSPSVDALAELGVRRISVGGALAFAAYAAVVEAARELQGPGTSGYLDGAALGLDAVRAAFGD
jgi:2-methylisocitrate lyase-like PEP mutase family enzyme